MRRSAPARPASRHPAQPEPAFGRRRYGRRRPHAEQRRLSGVLVPRVPQQEQRHREHDPQQGASEIGHGLSSEAKSARAPDRARRSTGVATQQPARGQVSASCSAVTLDRFDRIARAGRLEAALRSEPGAEQQSVQLDPRDQRCLHGAPSRFALGADCGSALLPSGRAARSWQSAEECVEFVPHRPAQRRRRGARISGGIERRAQPDDPQSRSQGGGVARQRQARLTFDEISCHGAARMPLRHDETRVNTEVIHRTHPSRCIGC